MRTPDPIEIGGHLVGPGERPFVIAEVSGNHNGSLDRALEIVDAIAGTGAQAVKFQTYRADTITIDADGPAFRIRDDHGLWGGRNLYQLYEQAHTPWEWHEPLFARAREHGLVPFSSPFDPTAIELLESLDAPAYKVASAELVDLPLIRAMAATGKPMVISTGMATLAEIDAAVAAAREGGATQIVLLACTASYPADPVDANLQTIPALREAFGVPIGLSDHTPGIGVPVAAVALGAVAIEKHVTLRRDDGGVDSDFSLEPAELASLVTETDVARRAMGPARFGPRESERDTLALRRSLWVVADVAAGEKVTADNVRSIRPAGGLHTDTIGTVLGRTFTRDVARGTPLTWDLI
ncbi:MULTISPECIES: pseudaminic acid synthase [unclassified Pseudonocardia]|uniref:pseudaminic acid synthase n=1 Tax=unclassified Pseudonocardia TaxID=2619320 RepID=UPI0006CB2B6F|nr:MULTISPECIES: pseudaminic acid synthase [unclassified Pseudonocardia]ALE85950.1 N-acetylneuraminate synthase [Pseudonocardia sp. HH130629-09]